MRGGTGRIVRSRRHRHFLTNSFLSLVLDLPRLGGVGGEHAVDPQLVREVLELLDVGLALFGDDHVRCFTLG